MITIELVKKHGFTVIMYLLGFSFITALAGVFIPMLFAWSVTGILAMIIVAFILDVARDYD